MGHAQPRNNMSDAVIKAINWRCFGSQKDAGLDGQDLT